MGIKIKCVLLPKKQLQGNNSSDLWHLHDSPSYISNQEVVERSAQEVTSINHNTLRDEYAAKRGAPLTRGED